MEFKPGHTVGIDLGTTFSTLAILDEKGDPVAVANDDGDMETPSLIVLAESDGADPSHGRRRRSLASAAALSWSRR